MHVMDLVLKALGDKTRRTLLDKLRTRDGQSLTELESDLEMQRFGVMKHLKILEEAHLVLTHKSGRFKYHYLNVAPLQSVVDRWIEPLTRAPATRSLLDLKANLEGETVMSKKQEKPDFMLETFIAASPTRVWEALTSAEISRQYYIMGAAFHGELKAGKPYEYRTADGKVMLSGEIISARRPHHLEMTFLPGWSGKNAKLSRNVFQLKKVGAHCKLVIMHFDIPLENAGVREGWARIVSGLKTLLETGKPVQFV
jgi:uncharacterized protein YndB with AHSA1/START domain/DNA-binding transcriptional ArsR family regulator